jgi:hypothetical protein
VPAARSDIWAGLHGLGAAGGHPAVESQEASTKTWEPLGHGAMPCREVP